MKYILYFVIIFFTFLIQSTFLTVVSLEGIMPNLMLIITIALGFLKGEYDGLCVGCMSGFIHDIIFAPYIGGNIFLYGLVGFLVGIICKEFYKENVITPMVVTAFATLGFEFGNYILIVLLSGFTNIGYYSFVKIMPSVMYNSLVMIPLYILVFAINGKFERKVKHKRKVF